jgi:hypothetical protein
LVPSNISWTNAENRCSFIDHHTVRTAAENQTEYILAFMTIPVTGFSGFMNFFVLPSQSLD